MKVAIPTADGMLCMHFGHCEAFVILTVDGKTITDECSVDPPAHQPGLLPPWLAEQGVTHVIAGGMGQRAQALFRQRGIEVIVGAPAVAPRELVQSLIDGSLEAGENVCDH